MGGSREVMTFTRSDVEKVMELAQKAGDHELLSRSLPKKPLVAVKRDLVLQFVMKRLMRASGAVMLRQRSQKLGISNPIQISTVDK